MSIRFYTGLRNNRYHCSSAIVILLGVLFIFAGHFLLENNGGHALFMPFNTLSWIPIFFLLSAGTWQAAKAQTFRYSELTRTLFLACSLMLIPLLYPLANLSEVIYRIVGLWAGLLLFIAVQQADLSRRHFFLIFLFVLAGVWIEAIRYWLYMHGFYLAEQKFPPAGDMHLFGVFQQRNVMSSFMATGIIISGYLLTQLKQIKYSNYIAIFLVATPFVSSQILQSMSSRAGWYGAVIGVCLLLPYLFRNAPRKPVLIWIAMIFLGLSLSFLLVNVGGWSIPAKTILGLEGGRTVLFPQAIAMFIAKPLLGFGYGTFEHSYTFFAAEQYALGNFDQASIPTTFHPHNEFLYWGVEGGIVPVIGLLVAAWAVWKTVAKFDLLHRLAIIGLFLPIAFHSQVEMPFYASVMHYVIFILLISYVDNRMNETVSVPLGGVKVIKTTSILIPAVATVFLVSTVYTGVLLAQYNKSQITREELSKINNPIVWIDRLNFSMSMNNLVQGLLNSNPVLIQSYVNWAPNLIVRQPRPIFYEYLIAAHKALGENERADVLLAEFKYLFPETEFKYLQSLNVQ